jgi:cytochrome c-type biogenesis protein
MQDLNILIAFGAGLLSFLSPCVLPIVPVYFASMLGGITSTSNDNKRLILFSHSILFVSGLTVVFTVLGAGAGLLGLAISENIILIRHIAGGVMVLMGLLLLLSNKVPWLNFEKHLKAWNGGSAGYLRTFITGGVFAFGWTPCVGPILGGILALALGTGTAINGAYLLAAYSLGLGLPFLIMGIAFDFLRHYLTWLQRYSAIIHIFSGILMIAIGILILLDKLAILSISV